MSTTTRQDRDQRARDHDLVWSLGMAAGVAATAVVGYGIALGLSRATQYAEKVEEDEYIRPVHVVPGA